MYSKLVFESVKHCYYSPWMYRNCKYITNCFFSYSLCQMCLELLISVLKCVFVTAISLQFWHIQGL